MMLETLIQVTKIFDEEKIDYCIIGGLAMMLYHGRASTVYIDFYVLVDDLTKVKDIFDAKGFEAQSAGEYQLKCKVNNVPIDVLWGDPYVGADVVKRAASLMLGAQVVRVATPEDIIVLKTLANRAVDRRDIEELRELFAKKLDEKYIDAKLNKIKKEMES